MTTNPFSRALGRVSGAVSAGATRMRDRRALAKLPAHVLVDMGIEPDSVRSPPHSVALLMLMQR
jgi:uncharacterized protein YjiS (DUF1127 family)